MLLVLIHYLLLFQERHSLNAIVYQMNIKIFLDFSRVIEVLIVDLAAMSEPQPKASLKQPPTSSEEQPPVKNTQVHLISSHLISSHLISSHLYCSFEIVNFVIFFLSNFA